MEIAERMLVSIDVAMKHLEKLMESEDVHVFALYTFTKLAEIEIVLMESLGANAQADERNPLARRLRIEKIRGGI